MSDETACTFVSSRGILKSCDYHSANPKSSCATDTGYLSDMLRGSPTPMRDGMSIYVCSDLLRYFVTAILPKMSRKFVLVSGDSDMCVPSEALTEKETVTLLHSSLLCHWFAQNLQIRGEHPKMTALPIGLDYHTIAANPRHHWRMQREGCKPVEQEKILCEVAAGAAAGADANACNGRVYVNFSLSNDRFGQRRESVCAIPRELLSICQDVVPRTRGWQRCATHRFVLSPFGMGMDCHRTWEALSLGCVPIVCDAPHFSVMFYGLPVLQVSSWSEVTRECLDAFDYSAANTLPEKLLLSYWVSAIRTAGCA